MRDVYTAPTEEMDVYAFSSTLYTVRLHPAYILSVKLMKPYMKVFAGIAPFGHKHWRLETAIREIGLYGHRRLPQPDGISSGLWGIIQGCWEYCPANRPHMKYVVDALTALAPAQPSAAASTNRQGWLLRGGGTAIPQGRPTTKKRG